MIVNTPDGPRAFPDDMSQSDIAGVMKKLYPPTAPPPDPNAYRPGYLDKITNLAVHSATLGLDDLLSSGTGQLIAALGGTNKMPSVAQEQAQRAQQSADVGPWASGAANIAGYAAGGGAPLGQLARKIAGTGIMGGLTEGALAGGISGAVENPNAPISSGATGALTGGAVGAGAGLIGRGLNRLISGKTLDFDPDAVVSATKSLRDQAFAPLKPIQFDPNDVARAYSGARASLTPGLESEVSPGFNSVINRQLQQIGDRSISADDIVDYARALRDIGSGGTNGDRVLAKATADNLEGAVLGGAQPVSGHQIGEAANFLSDAKAAHQNYANAQALQQWQQQLKTFHAGPGGDPQKIAETYYDPDDPEYEMLGKIARKAGGGGPVSAWTLSKLLGTGLEYLGASVGGGPGAVAGEFAGHLAKAPLSKTLSSMQRSGLANQMQAAYPTLTGASPTQWPSGVGDLLKKLAIGGIY